MTLANLARWLPRKLRSVGSDSRAHRSTGPDAAAWTTAVTGPSPRSRLRTAAATWPGSVRSAFFLLTRMPADRSLLSRAVIRGSSGPGGAITASAAPRLASEVAQARSPTLVMPVSSTTSAGPSGKVPSSAGSVATMTGSVAAP